MNVRWAPEAIRDRIDIMDYLGDANPRAALKLDELFDEAAAKLAAFPMLGRKSNLSGTRELFPHEHYRLIYEIVGDTVVVFGDHPHRPPVAAGSPMKKPPPAFAEGGCITWQ